MINEGFNGQKSRVDGYLRSPVMRVYTVAAEKNNAICQNENTG